MRLTLRTNKKPIAPISRVDVASFVEFDSENPPSPAPLPGGNSLNESNMNRGQSDHPARVVLTTSGGQHDESTAPGVAIGRNSEAVAELVIDGGGPRTGSRAMRSWRGPRRSGRTSTNCGTRSTRRSASSTVDATVWAASGGTGRSGRDHGVPTPPSSCQRRPGTPEWRRAPAVIIDRSAVRRPDRSRFRTTAVAPRSGHRRGRGSRP